MLVFLNGEFVPEERAVVSVFDRSFLYGDGLFETMCVVNGKPFRWAQHMERLRRGADFLRIKIPLGGKALAKFAAELIAKNQLPNGLLRLTLSRGVGLRGYSPKGADKPTLVMTLHPAPEASGIGSTGWKLITASFRLPAGETLAHFKTANKLAQVLARAEADTAGADEALLLNTDGFAVEGASSNLFWVQSGAVCTPPMTSGVLGGVTRAVVLELCHELALPVRETTVTPVALREAEGAFLTLSTLGVMPAAELDGVPLRQSPLVEKLGYAYGELLKKE
jgi:branched-chain amino acid aminotransferase